jgi:hypothetical protein
VIKSLRMSEILLRMIVDECKSRKLGFSDYMRDAAVAGMKQHISGTASCDGMSGADFVFAQPRTHKRHWPE